MLRIYTFFLLLNSTFPLVLDDSDNFFIRGFDIFFHPLGQNYGWSITVSATYNDSNYNYEYVFAPVEGIVEPSDASSKLQIFVNGYYITHGPSSVFVASGDWLSVRYGGSIDGEFAFQQVGNDTKLYYNNCEKNLYGCSMDRTISFLPCICDSENYRECSNPTSLLLCPPNSSATLPEATTTSEPLQVTISTMIPTVTFRSNTTYLNSTQTQTLTTVGLLTSSTTSMITTSQNTTTQGTITTHLNTTEVPKRTTAATLPSSTSYWTSQYTMVKIERNRTSGIHTPATNTLSIHSTTEIATNSTEAAPTTSIPLVSTTNQVITSTPYAIHVTLTNTADGIPDTTLLTTTQDLTTVSEADSSILPLPSHSTSLNTYTSSTSLETTTDFANITTVSNTLTDSISSTATRLNSTTTNRKQPSTTHQPTTTYVNNQTRTTAKSEDTTFTETQTTDQMTRTTAFLILPTYTLPPGDPVLRNLSETTVTLDNVSEVLNTVQGYTNNSADLGSTDIGLVSVTLLNCASVNGLNTTQASSVLLNIDLLLNADATQFQRSGNQNTVLSVFPQLASNTDSMNYQYLNGANLGYISSRKKDVLTEIGLSDDGHTFTAVNGATDNPKKTNTIYIPASVVEQSISDSNRTMLVTIFRNRKLFIGNKKYRLLSNDKEVQFEDGDGQVAPNPCQRQVQPSQSSPILSASVVGDNGTTYSTVEGETVMAKIQFDVSNILQSLHGDYEVTWWNETSQEWSTSNQCQVKEKGAIVYADCPHLTGFALIVNCPANDPKICQPTLTTIGLVINSISVVCLMLLILVNLIVRLPITRLKNFRKIIRSQNDRLPLRNLVQIASISTLFLFFVLFSYFIDGSKMGDTVCQVMGPLTYTLLISNICLTMVLTIQTSQNAVMSLKSFTALTYLVYWIGVFLSFVIPTIISICLYFFTDSFVRNDGFCWIRPDFIVPAVVFPISCLIVNDIMSTVYVAWTLYTNQKQGRRRAKGQFKSQIIYLIVMQINCGLPWIVQYFTLFNRSSATMDYVFTIIIGLQGFVIALLYAINWQSNWWRMKSSFRQSNIRDVIQYALIFKFAPRQNRDILKNEYLIHIPILRPNPEALQRYLEIAAGAAPPTEKEKSENEKEDKIDNESTKRTFSYIAQNKKRRQIQEVTISVHL